MKTSTYDLIPENNVKQIGLIVLQSDVTIEDEFRNYFKDAGISLLVSRIPFENEVTVESLQNMAGHLKKSTSLFPLTHSFDAVGYACTSGAMQIGDKKIASLIQSERPANFVTNPMQAALTAFKHLGVKNIGYIGPYSAAVCQTMINHIEANGHNVPHAIIFDEEEDKYVGRISPETIYDTAINLKEMAGEEIDAIFISCTNMKCISILPNIKAVTGIPALSSNMVLAWDLARSSDIPFEL